MKSPKEIQGVFQETHDNLLEALTETGESPELGFSAFGALLAIHLLAFRLDIDLHQSSNKVPATAIEPEIRAIIDKKLCSVGITAEEERDLAEFMNNRTSQLG